MATAFQANAFQNDAFQADTGGGVEFSASVFNVSTLSSLISTRSLFESSVVVNSLLVGSLTKGTTFSTSMSGTSSVSCEITDTEPGLFSNINSASSLYGLISVGTILQSLLHARSSIAVSLTTNQDTEPDGITQNKKLVLLHDAGIAYPLNTINDAMDTYLEQRYTVSGGLSDLIARYLSES